MRFTPPASDPVEARLLQDMASPCLAVRRIAIGSKHVTKKVLLKALETDDIFLHVTASSHPKADHTVLLKSLQYFRAHYERDHPSQTFVSAISVNIVTHPQATSAVLLQCLRLKDHFCRQLAVQHPNASSEVLTAALDDPVLAVCIEAAHSINLSPQCLLKALSHHDPMVRGAAKRNPLYKDPIFRLSLSARLRKPSPFLPPPKDSSFPKQ